MKLYWCLKYCVKIQFNLNKTIQDLFSPLIRALRKNPSARERPPLVMLQKTRKAGREAYTVREAETQATQRKRVTRWLQWEETDRVRFTLRLKQKASWSRGREAKQKEWHGCVSTFRFSADCKHFRKSCLCQSRRGSNFVPPEGAETTTVTSGVVPCVHTRLSSLKSSHRNGRKNYITFFLSFYMIPPLPFPS